MKYKIYEAKTNRGRAFFYIKIKKWFLYTPCKSQAGELLEFENIEDAKDAVINMRRVHQKNTEKVVKTTLKIETEGYFNEK